MSVAMVRDLYDYHRWANRRLFDVALALGEPACAQEVGKQFSVPTLRQMFAHVYMADANWLQRCKGVSPPGSPFVDMASMAEVRGKWDALEAEQKAFIDAQSEAGLGRVVEYKNSQGQAFRMTLGVLLQHVANHATHHRSEIATMLTMLSGSPPDTGVVMWHRTVTGQLKS